MLIRLEGGRKHIYTHIQTKSVKYFDYLAFGFCPGSRYIYKCTHRMLLRRINLPFSWIQDIESELCSCFNVRHKNFVEGYVSYSLTVQLLINSSVRNRFSAFKFSNGRQDLTEQLHKYVTVDPIRLSNCIWFSLKQNKNFVEMIVKFSFISVSFRWLYSVKSIDCF